MNKINKIINIVLLGLFTSNNLLAQNSNNYITTDAETFFYYLLAIVIIVPILFFIFKNYLSFRKELDDYKNRNEYNFSLTNFFQSLDKDQKEKLLQSKPKKCSGNCKKGDSCANLKNPTVLLFSLLFASSLFAQTNNTTPDKMLSQPGIIITITLVLLPILFGVWYAVSRAVNIVKIRNNDNKIKTATQLAEQIKDINSNELKHTLETTNNIIVDANNETVADDLGIIQGVSNKHETHFTALKKKSTKRPSLDPDITKLILWYIGCAAFWLVVGTAIGEYVGIKFVAPDADHISWLSFGRLRPVHTNIVFWGWASLGMLGLGYYVVPTVSNTKIYSIKWGWIALLLTNLMVVFGTICLMCGFNNGGGEFREYVWPVMALFAVALILTLLNFILTVAKRTTKEIYISNWYIVSAIIFTIIVALAAYLPFWQDGVSETIVQGYFMHSGVGMWFTLYTLGLLYYFIPQQINKPIYAYSLGILAFWTQIIFYTIIGTHHFTFAPIPWWLQTVGIVGSVGMIIPVTAATINFIMTFKGQWAKVSNSYTLPFFFVAVIYYFVVSMQGTAEAFKFTNLIWHFTDFTVAHAHLGFYGIITFALWGGMYAIVPRLTGKEPPQYLVGAHFWIAFVGLLFYTIPLSIGATLRGVMWMEGKPFIDSVVMMFDWWLWRAIGGSLMFISHIVFFYNFYKMTNKQIEELDIKEETLKILEAQTSAI
jgi:cytochrome c oxidase cbb3-type subunit I